MRLRFVFAIISGLLISAAAHAQLMDDYIPPRNNCCLVTSAKTLADQLQDWNQLGRYYAANQELRKQPADPKRVVFMGDSITDGWRLADYFPGKPYVDRGISGQVTQQMVVRMYQDVIDLKPAAMAVLAGTNDIARNNGPETAEMVQESLMAMTELAQAHGIKVILCSVLPISDYPYQHSLETAQNPPAGRGAAGAGPGVGGPGGRGMGGLRAKQTDQRPPEQIVKLNAWMKDYAAKVGATYVDYFSAVVDEKGWLKDGISTDGLHPNADGYKIMAPLVQAAIDKVVR